jgi:hypothetical protein
MPPGQGLVSVPASRASDPTARADNASAAAAALPALTAELAAVKRIVKRNEYTLAILETVRARYRRSL